MKNKPKNPLRCAYKKIKFWYKAFLETSLMNDDSDRRDFQEALDTIKNESKKQSGI